MSELDKAVRSICYFVGATLAGIGSIAGIFVLAYLRPSFPGMELAVLSMAFVYLSYFCALFTVDGETPLASALQYIFNMLAWTSWAFAAIFVIAI